MVISIIGGSGSGKDTQAAKLSKHLDIPHISMGGILRSEEKKGNPLAIKAMKIANQGKWVPDEIVSQILENHVKDYSETGFIITGYPRYLEQCHSFMEIVDSIGQKLAAVVLLDISEETMYQRMQTQRNESQPGGKREDTDAEAIRQRIKSYQETIDPIIDYYKQENLLLIIDGELSREGVFEQMLSKLEPKLN